LDEIVMVGGPPADVAAKGTDLHEVMELFDSAKTYEDLTEMFRKKREGATYDVVKYDHMKALPRLWRFWCSEVKAREEGGWKVKKEGWTEMDWSLFAKREFKTRMQAVKMCGSVDLLLTSPERKKADRKYIVIDYKTGGTASISEDYKRQLMTYGLLVAEKYEIPYAEIADRISLALFFPMAKIKDEESIDESVAEKEMLRNLKYLKYTKDDLDDLVREVNGVIAETGTRDWSKIDPIHDSELKYTCSWCPFNGSGPEQGEIPGFIGCPRTRERGYKTADGVKFVTKADAKVLEQMSVRK